LLFGSEKMQVRHLETVLDNRRFEPVTYWFTVGSTALADSKMKKWAELDYTLRQRVIPDGLLVRVSSINQDSHAAYTLHRNFLAQLMPAVMPRYRERLFGSALSS
ncbi:exosortase C-terminal domain/associated protein EpsI, partial [Craterilacuibacter sp.]